MRELRRGPDMSIPQQERENRRDLAARQGHRLAQLLAATYGRSPFYTRKLDEAGIRPSALRLPDDLSALPLTSKAELVSDQEAHPPWGTVLTEKVLRRE